MNTNNAKIGSVEGTGAVLNVECGFIPSYVKILNIDDAGSLFSSLEWFQGMATASGLKTKSIADDGTTANKSSELITSNGISEFAGSVAGAQLTGTVAATAGSATLSGTNTLFLTELAVGDVVKLADGQEMTVTAISSATSLTASAIATASVTTKPATRVSGKKAGFTLGAETDLNASGETIKYIAIR